MNHHITRRDGLWQVWWKHIKDGKAVSELIALSPHGIMDAWNKAMDAHGQKAAEAYQEMKRIENER